MAASAFSFPSNGATVALLGTKLHEFLIAKGWEIQWANAAAIGTGTATNPKWDATPTISTSAGIVSYLSPLAGLTNRWTINIELAWGSSSVAGAILYTQTAQGINTSTGMLTNAGRRNGWTMPAFNAGQHHVTVSEYGFAVVGAGQWHGVERRRLIGNSYVDDLISHQFTVSSPIGFTTGGRNVVRNWATGEYGEDFLVFLTGLSSASVSGGADISTLSSGDGNVGYPAGPMSNSNGLGGMLRHVQCFRPNDSIVGIDQAIDIDGQQRLYFPTNVAGPGGLRLLMARS